MARPQSLSLAFTHHPLPGVAHRALRLGKPGPGGADVVFNFNVIELDSQHGVGFHEQVLPPNVLVNTTPMPASWTAPMPASWTVWTSCGCTFRSDGR